MNRKICLLIGILLFFSGCGKDTLEYVDIKADRQNTIETGYVSETVEIKDTVKVHVCGEVQFPGVYTLYSGSRVDEAVKQAGGFTFKADTTSINLAKEINDGEQIYIPSFEEIADETGKDGLININKADVEKLCTIPGIGETRAKQIIEYRKKNGSFQKIEDIMNVAGIKEGTFEKIAPYITVS